MGYYIEVPEHHHKARQLQELMGAKPIGTPVPPSELPDDQALICVMNNGPFEAAGLVYDDREFEEFVRPDGRQKWWLVADRDTAYAAAGYTPR